MPPPCMRESLVFNSLLHLISLARAPNYWFVILGIEVCAFEGARTWAGNGQAYSGAAKSRKNKTYRRRGQGRRQAGKSEKIPGFLSVEFDKERIFYFKFQSSIFFFDFQSLITI